MRGRALLGLLSAVMVAGSIAQPWWRAGAAPDRWSAALPAVAGAVRWQPLRPGLDYAELPLGAARGTLFVGGDDARSVVARLPVRVVLVRLDPRRFTLRLHAAARPAAAGGGAGPWSVDAAPPEAALALNAGQFTDAGPWGWVVHGGRELQAPGAGTLGAALVVDTAGRARVVGADSVAALHAAAARGDRAVAEAVQSYPALLDGDGRVPPPLLADGRGVDRTHRDARLAVGELRDGRLLVALTRLDVAALARVPVGLTVPEMAALAGALGCRRAVLLDGGLSAQLLARDAAGGARRWAGARRVPLGLVASARGAPTR